MLGTMTHCAVLEPDCFDARHVIAPKVDRRTKAGKDEWQAFVATLKPGQEPADPDMAVQATAMAASILRIEPLRQLLAAGEAEVSAFYEDPVSGVRCRVRPDWVYPAGDAGVVIVDVKTCPDASAAGFAKSVANWSYDVQAAMYCDGYEAASGTSVHGFVFAVVEKDYPYGAAAYMLPEEVIDAARRRYRRHLQRFAECQQSGQWPGYTNGDEIRMLTMPAWAMKDDE
jgi:exodeoxyribonuclease VIII